MKALGTRKLVTSVLAGIAVIAAGVAIASTVTAKSSTTRAAAPSKHPQPTLTHSSLLPELSASAIPSVPAAAATGPKVLVLGDSIAQGMIGDYTWRYRLLQNFQATHTRFRYVGHRTGTYDMYLDPSYAAEVNGEPVPDPNHLDPEPSDGAYRVPVSLPHDAQWGWSLSSARAQVPSEAQAYPPDYLIVALGFNDLALGRSVAQAQQDLRAIISTVRQYSPQVKVLVSNVIRRTPLAAVPNLNTNGIAYDQALPGFAASLTQTNSPVAICDVASQYNAASDSWDGLHPNSIGEFKIARAMAGTLRTLGLGSGWTLPVPTRVDAIALGRPKVWLENTPAGIKIHWSHVYGASGYRITVGPLGGHRRPLPLPVSSDWWLDRSVHTGTTYGYSVQALRGSATGRESNESSILAATMAGH